MAKDLSGLDIGPMIRKSINITDRDDAESREMEKIDSYKLGSYTITTPTDFQ